ncbi:NADP-dependent oxidoreductase [Ktedonosporobacter rubrisoli]|uniref:NADP-dependent oxidoreductase n=1 Tax=Ktedonosporobacter rubrisoli TaxID=2509675 RepID=A0A4P6JXV9_KTERU|nr:NADP-dependent oxidoreductase [Ktedonosporobacter rubrisoli]QBD80504.1 NADP-dependent oxidoreductase [Ktedonosporobacter rubrisoli]
MHTEQLMRAVRVHQYGGPEQLKLERIERPEPREGEVLLRVHAAGVNPLDWKIRQGLMKEYMPRTLPYIPGIEVSGVVEAVGPGVPSDLLGQAVFGGAEKGTYAEYITVSAAALARKPQKVSFAEAATIKGGAMVAWRALFEHGQLAAGQRILIQGAAGGVGLLAVQLAKWKGAQVIATTSAANLDFVRSLGADQVVDYTTTPIAQAVKDVDIVLDAVGGETLLSSLDALRAGGTLISLAGPPPLEKAAERRVRAMFSRGESATPLAVLLETLTRLVDEGKLKVVVGKTFALDDVQQAHVLCQNGHGRGRIVLLVAE